MNSDDTWQRILDNSGHTFNLVKGKEFTYKARGRTIYLQPFVNRKISRSAIETGLSRAPLKRVSDVQDLSAPSYLFAILTDPRIVSNPLRK